MRYKNFDINNDDVVCFMEWYKEYLDEVKLMNLHEIIDTMIDMVRRPHLYEDDYQKFRAMELVE